MKKKFKRLFIGLISLIVIFAGIGTIQNVRALDGVVIEDVWYETSGALLPLQSTWTVGSSSVRVAKGWLTDLDVSGIFTLGGVVGSGGLDLNGTKLTLDADADTSITADTDDQIDIEISGADDFRMTANTFTALAGSSVSIADGGLNMGSATVDAGLITLIKGAQTSDPQVILALSSNANGDFSITTSVGDIDLVPASDVDITLPAGSKVLLDGSTTPQTQTAGALDINTSSLTANTSSLNIATANTATIGNTAYGFYNAMTSSAVVTGTNQDLYASYNSITKTGADTNANTTNIYAVAGIASNTGSTATGVKNIYGGYFTATGDSNGLVTAVGIYATASGGDFNYAGLFDGTVQVKDGQFLSVGNVDDFKIKWTNNATGNDIAIINMPTPAGNSAAIFISRDLNPAAMTDHDGYLSPTLVMVNDEGADANDYSAVVIGERAQANVAATHYFDFYAMTGSADGSVNATTTEVGATFRFGDNPAAGTIYTGAGDVIFNDNVEFQDSIAILKGQRVGVTNVNAATYDLLTTDYILDVSYTGTGAVTSLTLPTAQMLAGRYIIIKDTGLNAGTNNITIDTEGAELIDGADTYVMNLNKQAIGVFVNAAGTGWFVIHE